MAEKQRYQNPALNDSVVLKLFAFNSNNKTNFHSIEKIDIYYLDKSLATNDNPDGRVLVTTIDGANVSNPEIGLYSTTVDLTSPYFTKLGIYLDVWTVVTVDGEEPSEIENNFQIYQSLWFTSTTPTVYDFNFAFRPNKVRLGSKKYIIVEITPNVPNESDLYRYYENLAIVAPVKIYIEQKCGDCIPEEEDLRLVVDGETIELREKCVAYYQIDTTEDSDIEFKEGIYNVWFQMELGDNIYVGDKQQLQIFK